jgi:serine/threonine-protein kinase RsbW
VGGGILLGYRLIRKLMLDQTWNHEKGYIKPLHFPSGKLSKTFYFSAKNQSNIQFGILGEVTQASGDLTEVMHTVDRTFRDAASEFDDIHRVAKALYQKLDESHQGVGLSFQLWAKHKSLDHIPVISMGEPAMKVINKTFEEVVITFDTEPYISQNKSNFKCALVPLDQTQYLILSTDTCYLPELSAQIDSNENSILDSIFELSKHIDETIRQKRDRQPVSNGDVSNGEVSMVLMDLHDYTVTCELTLYGLEQCESHIETILRSIPSTFDPFTIKLILSELLMNAYKHGNGVDQALPIKVIVSVCDDELVIEVMDMSIRKTDIYVKTDINPDQILDEHGRGLFLVNAFSDKLTFDNNSVVSRIKSNKTEC